ncbi:hypothetical protein D5S17_01540 [Pseudonocardiaceae bacterium YIM PH 21723]|nr:hypothetical protein D5S17_01540 [Pseudonocardiaceae bacterium YIM PH 21723]
MALTRTHTALLAAVGLLLIGAAPFVLGPYFGASTAAPSVPRDKGHHHAATPVKERPKGNGINGIDPVPNARPAPGGPETAPATAGPASFTQQQPAGKPGKYDAPLERCAYGIDYPTPDSNPILAEPPVSAFTSNVPLRVTVRQNVDVTALTFTNTSAQPIQIDCAAIILRAGSGVKGLTFYNSAPYGHPQWDGYEVPKGDGTSFYIYRLAFHDVPNEQRMAQPGQPFELQLAGPVNTRISRESVRDSVRFIADLDLSGNVAITQKYGTQRSWN